MPELPEVLRRLHRILKQKTDLESRLRRGPLQVQAAEKLVAQNEEELAEAKHKVQRAKMAADDKQLQLKQREQRVEDLRGKLNTASSNKEYQAIKEQIAADEQANAVLADETFELLETIDALTEKMQAVAQRLETSKQDLSQVEGRIAEQKRVLEADLARVLEELGEAEKQLPAEIKADYLRLVKVKGEAVFAEVEGNTCGNCYQTLTPQIAATLTMKRTAACGGCGSFLYLPERR